MMKRFSLCAAALFAAILITQPALGQTWKAVGSSGNQGSGNPADWTLAVVSPDDENLYGIDLSTGAGTYIRGLRNNVDAIIAQEPDWPPPGQNGPFWGESYRDGQHVAYNPDAGLLYHRNGTTGYRAPDPLDPRAYDTRLIETYAPGAQADFLAAPVSVYNSLLTTRFGGRQPDDLDPDNPIDGTVFGESRSFTYDTDNDYFILANNDGNTGYWDPTLTGPASSVHVGSDVAGYRGMAFYDTNLDGGATANRLFVGVNTGDGGYAGNSFFELDNNTGSATYLSAGAIPTPASIVLSGTADSVDQTIGMAQNPETGDLYSIVTLSSGGRHLIRYDAADIDAYTYGDPFISATYLGDTGFDITAITFVPVTEPGGLAGDINGDGWVDGLDYLAWASQFGTHGGPPAGTADINVPGGDGWVDGLDYLTWAGQFGLHSASSVPEPGTFALAGLALAGLLGACRRRS
jgi:hypothetical protein